MRPAGPWRGLWERSREPGSFAHGVLALTTGTTLAQVIPVAAAPVLSRLYSPAEFGLFALYAGIAALFSVVGTGRYELAIVLPAEDEDAVQLLGLSLVLGVVVAAAAALGVAVFRAPLAAALRSPGLAGWLPLLPLAVLLAASAQALGYWLNRRKAYPRLAASRILQAGGTALVAVALARAGLGAGGLILGALAGQALATVLLAVVSWGSLRETGVRLTRRGMRAQAIRYRDFPRVNALHALLDNVNFSGSVILLGWFFNPVVVGQYSLVMRVLMAPVTLVGAAISQVFYQRAADIHQQGGDLRGLVRSLLSRTVWIALPAAILMYAGAPAMFPLVFGAQWTDAGGYARLLAPYMFFHFLAAPLAFLPFVLDRQVPAFLLSTAGNLLFLACIAAGGRAFVPELGFGLLSVVLGVFFVGYIAWMYRIARR
jgi:O-antigen/teichoic acid export membrane protein